MPAGNAVLPQGRYCNAESNRPELLRRIEAIDNLTAINDKGGQYHGSWTMAGSLIRKAGRAGEWTHSIGLFRTVSLSAD